MNRRPRWSVPMLPFPATSSNCSTPGNGQGSASGSGSEFRKGSKRRRNHHGSLRSKLVLSVAAIFFAFLATYEVVWQNVVEPEFLALEQQDAVRDAYRVFSAISVETEHLGELAVQLAHLQGSSGAAIPANKVLDQNLASGTIAWMLLADGSKSVRWLRAAADPPIDPQSSANSPNQGMMLDLLARCRQSSDGRCTGLTQAFDGSIAMFAAAPLGKHGDDNHDGGKHGERASTVTKAASLLIVGRPLDDEMVETLRRRTQVPFEVQPRQEPPSTELTLQTLDRSTLLVTVPLRSAGSDVVGQIQISVPRAITLRATQTTAMAKNLFILGATIVILLLLWMLQRIVVSPITAIRKHADKVAEQGLSAKPLVLKRNDEIGELAAAYDNMTRHLSDAQQKLTMTSRAAGASQVADTVIHNIGNVLTNVNSLMESIASRVSQMRIRSLQRLADRMQDSVDDEAFLRATPDYLRTLADSLVGDQMCVRHSVEMLSGNLRHIHEVIRDQRHYTRSGIDSERLVVGDLLRGAVDCCQATLEQDSVSVDFAGDLDTVVESDRSLLSQVFINIVGNAGQSLRQKKTGDRKLHIEVNAEAKQIEIRFCDNGVGIEQTALPHVFDAHFTTRSQGSGLGLHFCAIAVKRVGGSIAALSAGSGQGAVFVVKLPPTASQQSSAVGATPRARTSRHSLLAAEV